CYASSPHLPSFPTRRSSDLAFANLLSGAIDFMSVDSTWAAPMHPSRVRILAVTSAKRNPSLPNVPTLEELGLKDFDVSPWFGVLDRKSTRLNSSHRTISYAV